MHRQVETHMCVSGPGRMRPGLPGREREVNPRPLSSTAFGYKDKKKTAPPTDGWRRKVVNMSSNAVTRVSVEIAGSEISFETGRMAKQASGAVVVRQAETRVLRTATAAGQRVGDFLPPTWDGGGPMSSAGKIPASFF